MATGKSFAVLFVIVSVLGLGSIFGVISKSIKAGKGVKSMKQVERQYDTFQRGRELQRVGKQDDESMQLPEGLGAAQEAGEVILKAHGASSGACDSQSGGQ